MILKRFYDVEVVLKAPKGLLYKTSRLQGDAFPQRILRDLYERIHKDKVLPQWAPDASNMICIAMDLTEYIHTYVNVSIP